MLHVAAFDDGFDRDVAIQGKLLTDVGVERLLRAADEHVRLETDLAQLGHALLSGLGFEFARRLDVGDEGDVHDEHVAETRLELELADGLQEGRPSMSPVVPPISVMSTSAPELWPISRIRSLISSVMCGITCTVLPR